MSARLSFVGSFSLLVVPSSSFFYVYAWLTCGRIFLLRLVIPAMGVAAMPQPPPSPPLSSPPSSPRSGVLLSCALPSLVLALALFLRLPRLLLLRLLLLPFRFPALPLLRLLLLLPSLPRPCELPPRGPLVVAIFACSVGLSIRPPSCQPALLWPPRHL